MRYDPLKLSKIMDYSSTIIMIFVTCFNLKYFIIILFFRVFTIKGTKYTKEKDVVLLSNLNIR